MQCSAVFYAFTGCDTVSYFHNHGKRKAWEAWKVMPEVTDLFIKLGTEGKNSLSPDDLALLTRYVIVMYSRSSPHTDLSKARHSLFIEGRSIEHLPPTEGTLIRHCFRAILQAFEWIQSTVLNPIKLNPASFGWEKKVMCGNHCGPLNLMSVKVYVNLYLATAKCDAQETASAVLMVYPALMLVNALFLIMVVHVCNKHQ